ncbi:MAG: hypothetical protein CMH57_13010 [Myxococcales bacterium]|nr:hypothetical protein [Myxococcales bacterium]
MRLLSTLALLMLTAVGCAECDETPGEADAGGFVETDVMAPDIFRPDDPQGGGCSYGSGATSGGGTSGCAEPAEFDCTVTGCGRGTCVVGDPDRCECDAGYAGDLCNTCAVGFVPSGADCVPCDQMPCNNGTCVTEADGPATCACDKGYAGDLCDTCAEGFTPDGDVCVPSGARWLPDTPDTLNSDDDPNRKEST